jgi:hypothetical protein
LNFRRFIYTKNMTGSVTGLLFDSYGLMNVSACIHKLSAACADSKRKGKPQLYVFSSA